MRYFSLIMFVFTSFCGSANAIPWTTLDYPNANWTSVRGISGSNLVGSYSDSADEPHRGFFYDGSTWTALDYPEADKTKVHGLDGNNIVGTYIDYSSGDGSFLYDGTVWSSLDFTGTRIFDISGDALVGTYWNDSRHGFYYSGTDWITLDYPGSTSTFIRGIDDAGLVGWYFSDAGDEHGFFYDGSLWEQLDYPGSSATVIESIDGGNMVGYYSWGSRYHRHGFLYDGTNWHTFNFPGAESTMIYDIDGDRIVGEYEDGNGSRHGFVATIPEPGTVLLVGLGGLAVLRKRRS